MLSEECGKALYHLFLVTLEFLNEQNAIKSAKSTVKGCVQ